jgi:Cu/Ag efflux pump CusA
VEDHVDLVAPLQPSDHHLDVELAGAGDQHLLGLRITPHGDGWIFVADLGKGCRELVLVALRLRLEGEADGGLGDFDSREDVHRVAVLTANIAGRDLTGTVEAARAALDEQLELPSGYRLVFGGQFESAARSLTVIGVLSVIVLLAMYGLLFFAFTSHRQALIVLVNLPLAVVGGVIAVALGQGVLSVASLLGFITLFGIATRNGVLMVTRYQQLLERGNTTLQHAVIQDSEERMAPVIMTALTAGLALVPLVLAGNHPGNETHPPLGEVILGGLLSSTALNLVVVPALFARWGVRQGRPNPKPESDS